MSREENQPQAAGEVQVFELTMDNPEDQDELNRRLKKPGATSEPTEQRFRELEAAWRAETEHLSSTSKIINHPAFQAIIQLGEAVVPLMLKDLSEQPRLWVWALPAITAADPVSPADAGDIAAMSAAWLRWGREHGYQW